MPKPIDTIEAALARFGIASLTPMQQAAISTAMAGKDLVLIAPTGSGKTLAFLLPLLLDLKAEMGQQALIIVPTRELAQQIAGVWKQMRTGLNATLCYGGHKREIEERSLSQSPPLIIGTPGRLADHFRRGNIAGENIHSLVLDEFDKSLELGFQEEMAEVIRMLSKLQRRSLCSATEAMELPAFTGLNEPQWLRFTRDTAQPSLELQCIRLTEKDKADALFRLLCFLGEKTSVVFLNHRQAVERLHSLVAGQELAAVAYHGALSQDTRELALAKFRNGSARTLIATDLAARGLDIAQIDAVIHYHLPGDEAAFTHRNGRTARMGAGGTAILLIGPEEKLPDFISEANISTLGLPDTAALPPWPQWLTLRLDAGRKDKLSKADIVGFLTQAAGLKKEDIGLIEVHDFFAFIAVQAARATQAMQAAQGAKLKGQKRRLAVAR